LDPRFFAHPTRQDIADQYERGYERGRDALTIEMARECERLEYDPRMSILRGADGPVPT